MNKKLLLVSLVVVILVAAFAIPAVFAGGGSFSCCRAGSLHADGTLWGLGYHNAWVTMTAHGTVTAICQNNGGKQAPGRNPVTFNVSATGLWYVDENGKAVGSIFTEDPTLGDTVSPSPKDAGCPSDSWDVVGVDSSTIQWTDVNFTVTQEDTGDLFYTADFTCTGAGATLSCTQVP